MNFFKVAFRAALPVREWAFPLSNPKNFFKVKRCFCKKIAFFGHFFAKNLEKSRRAPLCRYFSNLIKTTPLPTPRAFNA